MAIPTASFVFGLLVLTYFSSFVVFAALRVVTGVSIQRLGLTSLRRIAYKARHGVKLEVRGLGLQIHRPTFAQPTWISLVITELRLALDLDALKTSAENVKPQSEIPISMNHHSNIDTQKQFAISEIPPQNGRMEVGRRKTWARLTEMKEKLKRLHRIILWIRLLDIVAVNSSVVILGIGTIQVGSVMVSVDTRPATVDRRRLFRHSRTQTEKHRPVEWTVSTRSVHFTPYGKDSIEIVDHFLINIHGFLSPHLEGLRDASISLKLGRVHIPYDDLLQNSSLAREGESQSSLDHRLDIIAETDPLNGLASDDSDAQDDGLLQTVQDARDFITSILRGIHEISFATSFVGLTKRIDLVQPGSGSIYLNMSMKELGMDFFRLDPTTPAHSMYFSKKDVAHQALISAISIAVGLDDGRAPPERLVYIPMTTATIKTTLPSKIIQFASHNDSADRNTNVFFANLVITSPSTDLDPRHLPVVLAIVENRPKSTSSLKKKGHRFASQLLPRASIKLSVHEPVIRVSLPPIESRQPDDFDFDLLILAISSISLDIESAHAEGDELHYSLTSTFRVASHKLYYQMTSRQKHDLIVVDSIEIKAQVTAAPEVLVVASANFQTFSALLTRPGISKGIGQIFHQLRSEVKPGKLRRPKQSQEPNFLQTLPPWLHTFAIQASDFNVEVADVDSKLSSQARGFALHLDSWTTEYKTQNDDASENNEKKRRAPSTSLKYDELPRIFSSQPRQKGRPNQFASRRLAFHTKGFEAFVIESTNTLEQEPFLSVPRSELAITTSHDGQSPTLHINSHTKSLFLQYSLFRYYAIGVAAMMLRKTFSPLDHITLVESHAIVDDQPLNANPLAPVELVTVDIKIPFVQIKARLPSNPHLMIHLHKLEAGRHRWASPFARAIIARLYAETPNMKHAWSRIVSIKNPRLDLREKRRKQGLELFEEKSIDFDSDAIRIGVPHELVVHKIFDNVANVAKATQQLNHRFRTDSDVYILQKLPEGPKHVPRISVRTHVLLFEIEDGAFEWKLGAIYRAGLVEQKQRIAREEAFRLKVARLQGPNGRTPSWTRAYNSQQKNSRRNQSIDRNADRRDENVKHPRPPRRSFSNSEDRGRRMRYDCAGSCNLSDDFRTTIHDAWERLQRLNAQSWKKRVNHAFSTQIGAVHDIRELLWGLDGVPDEVLHQETILQVPQRPPLMGVLISDVNIVIDKPSFPLTEMPDFMYRVGKGLPRDTQFSLLIPMNAQFNLGEVHITLRDYPLPVMHIPAIRPEQSPRLPSWSLKTDFVMAEEFRGFESTRDLEIMIITPEKFEPTYQTGGFAIDVRRTVSPVKTYSDIKIEVNTANDTRFTWGSSYQPAIQDMMQVIEGFNKPQVDPSDKVGFWDKIRLSFHSRLNIEWKGDGDVYMTLKGSRDPYAVTGHAAGFVMVWRNDVRWNIWQEEDPRKFMTVDSGDYVLAVPDFNHYARKATDMVTTQAKGSSSTSSHKYEAQFKKVIMKLSGKVRWQAGLVFEREMLGDKRSFDFEPHYNVTLKNPVHVKSIHNQNPYDAFRGFRSHYIHASIAIIAPNDRDWVAMNLLPSTNYNSIHLTPRFFTHFYAWWSMFSHIMSLPIRQGKLWPGIERSGKKFGQYLATIKYSILFSPLFISHIYKHKEAEEFSDDAVSATGLKMRLDFFVLDVHQRREKFKSEVKGLKKTVKTSGMKVDQTLLDLVSADIRAVSTKMTGTSAATVRHATAEKLAGYQETPRSIDLSKFTIPDNDFAWIDIDDFVEIDWTLPTDADPETKILPLAYSPRFTYRRQTDHQHNISGDNHRSSPFGYESTHHCVISEQTDPRQVQIMLIKDRLKQIEDLFSHHDRIVGEQELLVVREGDAEPSHHKKLEGLQNHSETLIKKKAFLNRMLYTLYRRIKETEDQEIPGPQDSPERFLEGGEESEPHGIFGGADMGFDTGRDFEHIRDFNNRFVVHNPQIKWNNSLRNIMLRYIHQVSQRRGFVYYTSRRAVKFILDIVEEQNKAKATRTAQEPIQTAFPTSPLVDDDELNVQERIQQLVNDGKKFVNADDPVVADGSRKWNTAERVGQDIAHDFMTQNTYHVRLVGPQIQLQSERNTKAAVLVTARGMRLKVLQIMDKDRLSDEVSGLVQRRFAAEMDNMQFFVTSKQNFASVLLPMYTGNPYGTSATSSWPPWVPAEALFDFNDSTYGFSRVVQRTSASLRYDNYNKLRLKNDHVTEGEYSDEQSLEGSESQMDHLWIDFPHLRAACDSNQYYAMYIIVLDVLMWSEPLEKTRHERLEKIMLASDFSDLRGAPEMVIMLQERIQQLDEIKTHFHVNEKYLDRQGWEDRISLEHDLTNCEDELFFIMKAITTAQRKKDDRAESAQVNAMLRWYLSATQIVWHLTAEANQPLVEFQLGNASYERTDNSDGSNRNIMEVDRIHGLNLLSTAIYPEMIAPYHDPHKSDLNISNIKMLQVSWLMLEAIAGIPVVDHFEVNLFPVKIALEYEIGKILFDYIFPGKSRSDDGLSPLIMRQGLPQYDEEDGSDYETHRQQSALASMNQQAGSATGAGSLEARLRPTLKLPSSRRPSSGAFLKPKTRQGLGISVGDNKQGNGLFSHSNGSATHNRVNTKLTSKTSYESISATSRGRELKNQNATNGNNDMDKRKRFALPRSRRSESADSKKSIKQKRSDDLTQMLDRASNYMTLAYVKIPSVVLSLSYKGKGHRNVEDVHNLVFRMPTLEYRNKTWSNLDLALALKKDVVRALISHTGAIIGNKFIHRKPGKNQASRLRELANSSVLLSNNELSGVSETSSGRIISSRTLNEDSPRLSDVTDEQSEHRPADLYASSLSTLGKIPEIGSGSETSREMYSPEIGQETREVDQRDPKRNSLARHFSELTQKARRADSTMTDGSEGKESTMSPARSKLKKMLHALPHRN